MMRRFPSFFAGLTAAVFFAVQPSSVLYGQGASAPALFAFDRATGSSALPNGVVVRDGDASEEITALRDDVLRVRVARGKAMPEDASWAVLAEARRSSVAVTQDVTSEHFGFRTKMLRVEIEKKTLRLTIRDIAGNVLQQDALPVHFDGAAFRVSKAMPLDEHYFGLGDKTGPLDRRDQAFSLWNTDSYRFQESTDPIYKAIPFFMTYKAGVALGVLLDNTWRTSFDFGRELPDVYSFGAVDGPLNYYVMYGPAPKQVVEDYAWLTGKPPMPPMWTLGFQQSRYTYTPESRVLEVAQRFRTDRIPADAIYLDIGFQDRNRPFSVDRKLFPDFAGMVAHLKEENFHVVAITDLHIAKAQGEGYQPYDSGMAGDHFVKSADGSVYSGRVWPGPSVFPDFTQQQTRVWWGTLYRDFQHIGIDGFWNDMNEPSVFSSPTKTMPLDVVHRIDEPGFAKRTATHAEIHDVYGMENSRATFDGLLALEPDTRPFVLTRATYAGGQRYAATWTGDNSSTWNHLRMTTPMLENLGLSGFSYAGADVGGYAGTPTPELLTKWLEVAAFQPIDRDHSELGTGDQEPWVGGAEQEGIRRRFIEERYRLMPYLYTLAEETSRTGMPMVRPLFLEFPDAAPDRHPLDVDMASSAEFLLGRNLLIAPSPWPEQLDDYFAELPSREWYDYWTGKRVEASSGPVNLAQPESLLMKRTVAVKLHPELATLPVFVRGGAILPVEPLVQSTNERPQGPLTLRVYRGGEGDDCAGSLYLDDGKTYAFRKGDFLRMQFSCSTEGDGLWLHVSAHEGSFPAWWSEIRVEAYGWGAPQGRVLVNGREAAGGAATALPEGFSVTFADDGKGEDVQLR
ncbi:TIM-barrel domain-containing protein [Granulicella sp. L60]|uniref:glycoside hydrolase family 31 protein n=1 Tax=Granulicella sp. L60 TaxID=1641866 RepID=UPI00131D264C|nr:TIM-barrel domain-containing protein [Granulicella sp. L60]